MKGIRILALCLGCAAALAVAQYALAAGHANFGCGECHVSHIARVAGSGPLWSTAYTAAGLPTFRLYSSATFDALGTDIGQPDGPSKLCLGCHDGSYAGFTGTTDRSAVFGPDDLARTHPISFTYDSALAARVRNGMLRDPATTSSGLGGTITADLLDDNGKVQCTSCHDVHVTGRGRNYLRYDYKAGSSGGEKMCRICHNA